MSRLVVISNRVPPVKGRGKARAGGLASALEGAFRGHRGLWFGWSGEVKETQSSDVSFHDGPHYKLATIDLSQENNDEYYDGFANRALWPLCHYRIDLVAYDRSFRVGYNRVNCLFASAVAPLLKPDDIVWVHDYHLILCGAELRKLGVTQPIGFFLHIPWPSAELVVTLPDHRALVRAMFEYDVIGFQTARDVRAFLDYVIHEAGGIVGGDGVVSCYGRRVSVGAYPIGIDAAHIAAAARTPEAKRHAARMSESLVGRKLIIGVDRLDYSKGIERRFKAYGNLLQRHPEHKAKVSMLQIAPPSRATVAEYQSMRRQLERELGRINGQFADYDWVPLRYVNQTYNMTALAGLYGCADVAFITPLRDGMNLVAKEYIAAQDGDDPGVLILSRFAGAALQLTSQLIVNPFDDDSLVEALQTALNMPLEERRRRWERAMDVVMRENIGRWLDNFLQDLTAAPRTATTGVIDFPGPGAKLKDLGLDPARREH